MLKPSKNFLVTLCLLFGFFPIIGVLAPNPDTSTGTFELGAPTSIIIGGFSSARGGGIENFNQEGLTFHPLSEKLDLEQVGSLGSPYIANLTENFDYIDIITFKLRFTSAQFDLSQFGGGGSLTNGVNVFYDSESIIDNENITQNEYFLDYAFKFVLISDQKASLEIIAGWEFPPTVLLVNPDHLFQFYIQDDITAIPSITEFSVIVDGFRVTQEISITDDEQFDLWGILGEVGMWWTNQPWLLVIVAAVSVAIWKLLIKS